MSDVPTELLTEIFIRVPAESLLRLRCVCKAWCRIIDDPVFVKSHLHHQNDEDQRILIRDTFGDKLYALSMDSISHPEGGTTATEAAGLKILCHRGFPRLPALPVASCDGLILLSPYDKDSVWKLWNPFTREFHELPPYEDVTRETGGRRPCGGFGCDGAADDYKVVRLAQIYDLKLGSYSMETLVYSLKLNRWRRIDDFSGCFVPSWGHGALVNGALHWITTVKQQAIEVRCIIAFELGTESYRLLPFPRALSAANHQFPCPHEQNLDALGGCLFLSLYYMIERLDVYKLIDYGGDKSWVMMFSFTEFDDVCLTGALRPVAYLKSKGQVLVQYGGMEFFWFDIEKKCATRVSVSGTPSIFSSQIFPASLVRLKNGGGGGANKP